MEHALLSCADDILEDVGGGRLPQTKSKGMSCTFKTEGMRKQKRRVVLLDEDKFLMWNLNKLKMLQALYV